MRSRSSDSQPQQDPNSGKLAIRVVAGRGRSVVARRKISRGEVIERAPVIVIPELQWSGMEGSVLSDYAFDWGEHDEHAVIGLGYISIYNHSYSPNAKLEQLPEELMMQTVALNEIQPEEEITINYNGDPANRQRLWFRVKPVRKPARNRRPSSGSKSKPRQ